MSKHTPGPWTAQHWIDDVHEVEGFEILAGGHPVPLSTLETDDAEEARDNARLIAAAPDLLAALEAIELGCSFPADDVQRAIRDRARAAIAEALGEKP